ncbi:MAG: hypothetical protein ACKPKO_26650, partial [Candidatus Fonsibacter sp.]
MATYIVRKTKIIEKRMLLMVKHSDIMREFEECDRMINLSRSNELLDKLEEVMQEIYATERPLAFRERCERDLPQATQKEQEQHQWEYFIATTFCDLWSVIYDKDGVVIGAFMTFYVCMANSGSTTTKCGTVICSNIWDRLKEGPLATGQRYYSNCCYGRYRHSSGAFIQIQAPGCKPSFCRATAPPRDNEDL